MLVLEKGGFVTTREMVWDEQMGLRQLYESRGVLLSTDSAVQLLAGSCVGGGTMVRYLLALIAILMQ